MADPKHDEYKVHPRFSVCGSSNSLQASIKDIVEDIIFYDFVAIGYADLY
jgi:hypothetical protein